ncbi:hypothetical protein HPB50_016510 [Hyalomma asiaticum]|uniref:Uncharacterized protein n=1 Tax=Hyalomma asiaticum TaxID=266040 RepID=A0ACB7T1C7_HYAAI|nr:hypothetical protein HPB50_016510 [Hyalomma asiaticum]
MEAMRMRHVPAAQFIAVIRKSAVGQRRRQMKSSDAEGALHRRLFDGDSAGERPVSAARGDGGKGNTKFALPRQTAAAARRISRLPCPFSPCRREKFTVIAAYTAAIEQKNKKSNPATPSAV